MAKKQKLQPDTYVIVRDAIAQGITFGYNRAHKHTNKPSQEMVEEQVLNSIMIELDNVVLWPER